jgi:hypothetical protein
MRGVRWCWLWLSVVLLLSPTAALAKKKKEIRQVVIREVTKVEGKIQKPEVWYLLPRSNLNFQGLKMENKLVPKIEESTKKDPF